jgi:hypothetical protein
MRIRRKQINDFACGRLQNFGFLPSTYIIVIDFDDEGETAG